MNKTALGLLSQNSNREYSQAALKLMEGMPSRNPNKPTIPVNLIKFRRRQKTKAINEEINYIKRRQNIQILLEHFKPDLYHTVQSVMIKPENGGIYYGDELINHFIINKINSNYKAVNNNTISEFINDYPDIILSQERLEEIFIKLGQQGNSEVFYKRFKVVEQTINYSEQSATIINNKNLVY
jgi:hypothetical protein